MLDVIKINLKNTSPAFDKVKIWLSNKGYLGSVALGVLFALAFCPYSGVLFFGALMPMVLQTSSGIVLPAVFALGTSLPVIIFSFLIAYSLKALGKTFQAISKVEKYLRYGVASVFILVGLYYLQYLAIYLWR